MVKIGVNNRQDVSSDVNNKYEFERIELNGLCSKYIYIPLSVIVNTELDIRRVGIFSYLRIHCGLNNVVNCTIPDIVEWCGGKPDRYTNGLNDKTLNTLDYLNDGGYLTYLSKKSKSSFMKCAFDMDYYFEKCSDGFAVLYLDEIESIMSYKRENIKDSTLNNATILLVFSYLRNKIRRRPNELKPEERFSDKIRERQKRLPDAFDGNLNDMAAELNISSKTISKIIDILEYDLSLIVTDRAYRVKNENGEYRTLPTIFANAYKREDKYLLDTGDDYSRTEIELKAENLQGYKINKKRRKAV